VETKWMVLANELVHHILGESKLTNMTLVPSPRPGSNAPYHPGISAVPRNGNSSTLTRADYLWWPLSYTWHHGVAFPGSIRSNVYLVHRPATHTFCSLRRLAN
jgi:hypothetical protein